MSIDAQHSAINRLRQALVAAVNRSDTEAASELWADDGRMMPPNQPTLHGREAIRAHFARLFSERKFRYTLTNCELHVSGQMAVERVEYHVIAHSLKDGSVTEDSGKGIHVYMCGRDGHWQLAEDIWNSDRGAKPLA